VDGGGLKGSKEVDAASVIAMHACTAVVDAALLCVRFGSDCVSSPASLAEEHRRAPIAASPLSRGGGNSEMDAETSRAVTVTVAVFTFLFFVPLCVRCDE
jgi:hypothetical protein